ncbi:hypothetical protein [Kitasatospora cineracea]|uniref:Uncharacterized protein n=1 Tax=Kitasatospora cineracea TaxID=88074 RepID=A0A8G1XDK6_9ACTN|nr:hypothetical protein [Kitasatospora cineracea]ROR44331.1 hypothetical protein EDD39_2522 [Kitasatospora cineracea]
MSRSELPEVDEAEDRPAIGAARLEAMFDGLRREVVLRVPAPASAEVVRRGSRRRRRRLAGAVAGAGVLGVAALWTTVSVVPVGGEHGVAGVPVQQSALPRPGESVTLALPQLPSLPPTLTPNPVPRSTTGTGMRSTAVPAGEVLPLESAEPEVRALALGVARLPRVLGGYGPWAVAPSQASASASAGPPSSATATASAAATGTATATSSGTASAPASAPASASVSPSAGPGSLFAEECLPWLVTSVGAERVWGETYADGGTGGATARQYVLSFGTVADAEIARARLLGGGACVESGAGWTVEGRAVGVVALGLRQPSSVAAAEEVAVHLRGSKVAVLMVHRGGRGVAPETGASDPFRASAAEFLALGAPEQLIVPVG